MKLFLQFLKEESLIEAIKPNEVLIKMRSDKRDPSKEVPTFIFDPRAILRAVRKLLSDTAKKAAAGAYIDGNTSIVNKKTSQTMAYFKVGQTLKDIAKDIEAWTEKNKDLFIKKDKPTIDVQSDTRVIITTDDETAKVMKKEIHNTKAKIKVRIMKRKEGAKVYIDTADKDGLDKAIDQVKEILQ